jgi:folate-binding Fe-S cluster repair protein YgfZ
MNKSLLLTGRALIRLEGPNTFRFAQGLLTNNVERLHQHSSLYAHLLSPTVCSLSEFA